MLDLDAVQARLEGVWSIYKAAEGWQEDHEHVCDVRCTAVNHIPNLTADIAALVAELRAARKVVEACRAIVRHPDTYYGGIGTQLAAEKALAAYDKVTREAPR